MKGNQNPKIRNRALSSCAAPASGVIRTPFRRPSGSNASKNKQRGATYPNIIKRNDCSCSHRRSLDGGQSEPENPQVNLVFVRRSREQGVTPLGASDVVVLPLSCRFMIRSEQEQSTPHAPNMYVHNTDRAGAGAGVGDGDTWNG